MSQQTVELATRIYEQLSTGSFDSSWDLLDPDLEWETSPNLPDRGVYKGRDRVKAFMEEQWEVVWGGAPRVDIERAFDCGGDDVLLFIRVRGTGSHTQIALDVSIAQLLTIRAGRLARVKVFPDRNDALKAAGLS